MSIYSARELHAEKASLVSGFNHWSESATPMTPLKDGRFKAAVDLAKDSNYQIRNLINDIEWRNDWDTDQYVPNPFSGDNSVVEV
ncbi:MAG: isoamylase early set domain-containing protein [Chloroflexi bacterium]|nr:isoamylase early set domain-containing protein [Chloroflexota bacterium]